MYKELGVTVIQQFTATNPVISAPLLPLLIYGPVFSVHSRVQHDTPESYLGASKSISYPNLQPGEYVDLGSQESWGKNEKAFPVRVFITDGKKVTDSHTSGYFASEKHYSGDKQSGGTVVDGFSNGTWKASLVGKTVYVHTGDDADQGLRTISSVSGLGDAVTLSGSNWVSAENVNISIVPSGGKVSRFYSSNQFSKARIEDSLELAPAYSTSYKITSVDPQAGYIDVALSVAPSGDSQGWRVSAEFDSVNISDTQTEKSVELLLGTDFSYDNDSIDIVSGAQDLSEPQGSIVGGKVKVSYRALQPSFALETGKIEVDDDLDDLGLISPYNPLAFALRQARNNTTFTVSYTGADVIQAVKDGLSPLDGPSKLSYASQLERIADEDVYILVPMSQYGEHNAQLGLHVDDVSDPNKEWNNVRIGIMNTSLITETNLQVEASQASWSISGLEEVQFGTDGQFYQKSGRLISRGSGESPDFNGDSNPLPVVPGKDLLKVSGSSVGNDGFWSISKTEKLEIRDPSLVDEEAPYRGYFAAYGNRIRSGSFKLTASDNAGSVRLTAPSKGAFRHLAGESFPQQARVFVPGQQDGVIANVTAVDVSEYKYIDTNLHWEAGFAGSELSQCSILVHDGVFAEPGLTASVDPTGSNAGETVSASNKIIGPAGFFSGLVGQYVSVSGTTAAADDGYHEILAVSVGGDEATVTSITTDDTGLDLSLDLVKISGIASKGEFAGWSAGDKGSFLCSGRDFSLSGNRVSGSKNLDSFPANTWGPSDVGKTIRIQESGNDAVYAEITAFVSETEVTTDVAVNFADSNAVTVQLVDIDFDQEVEFEVLSMDASLDFIGLNLNWSQSFAGNGLVSVKKDDGSLVGFGDVGRSVRILDGAYGGQSYGVIAARPEELILGTFTAFGTGSSKGNNSSAPDLNGFAIEFTPTPGNNTFSLSSRNEGKYVANDSGKTYSIQRDFRSINIASETFITKGYSQGDVLRISEPSLIAGDYEIGLIPQETELVLKQGSEISPSLLAEVFNDGTLDSLKYEVVSPKNKDQQAETIRDYASAFGNRRLVLMWPDRFEMPVDTKTTVLPGYYLGAMVGALASGFPPQKPLSRQALLGPTRVLNSKVDNYFIKRQINTIASGGVMVIHQQDDTDLPHVRHQLTTDTSDIKFQELSVTKIVDYISRIVKDETTPYTGKYNIGDFLISKMRTVAQAIVTFCSNQKDAQAGPLVNDISFVSIKQADVADELEMIFDIDAPIPFNRLKVITRA